MYVSSKSHIGKLIAILAVLIAGSGHGGCSPLVLSLSCPLALWFLLPHFNRARRLSLGNTSLMSDFCFQVKQRISLWCKLPWHHIFCHSSTKQISVVELEQRMAKRMFELFILTTQEETEDSRPWLTCSNYIPYWVCIN